MRGYPIILLMALIALLGGCELTVDVDMPEHEPKLVVNARMEQQQPIWVEVTESKPVLEDNPGHFKVIDDATVFMVVDETDTTHLDFDHSRGRYGSENFAAAAGRTYQIFAAHPNYDMASAKTTIPVPVSIENIKVEKQADQDPNGVYYTRVGFDIPDPPGEDNFYGLRLEERDSTSNRTICYESDNPVLSGQTDPLDDQLRPQYCQLQYFSNNLMTSSPYHIDIYIKENQAVSATLELTLLSYDEASYYYNRSVSQQANSQGNPFAEPVIVYSNIENGFGILGGFSLTTKEIIP